jgi:hypothetical protein
VRFLENGPSLPDELLVARDEGQVLFFCGAGVSRAHAGLPGFLGLAERVLMELRALPDSPARKLVDIAAQLEKEPIQGVGGILAADRIFGLLERDFALSDIEHAVGRVLRPQVGANLAAHRTLLELSRGQNGQVQLVTTNFDLLFESAAPKLPRWTPSQLPDLRRHERFHGIVHLHGMFDDSYSKPLGGNLVLSSSEFGRAYLAEGWATHFIREAIRRYLIVFVGYTADDPPVQYLLEALNRVAADPPRSLYAFQAGREDVAKVLWKQKGVTAIAYQSDNNHDALWQTLTAWSERAHDADRWRSRLIRRALQGPEKLPPHERGQVAHLAMTVDGARSLAEAKKPIPATWLCVFDPTIRYGTPGKANFFMPNSSDVDPFTLYSLDSDPVPPRPRENEIHQRRGVPNDIVNVFAPQPLDGAAVNMAGARGDRSSMIGPLPVRLHSFAIWLMRVCGQPAALWWASGQRGLHPVVLRSIQFALDDVRNTLPLSAHMAWRYLFEAWREPGQRDTVTVHRLKQRLLREGWTTSARREFARLMRPILTAARPYGARPPHQKSNWQLNEVLHLNVEYPLEEIAIEVPDAKLPSVLPLLRHNLERASALETEVHPYWLSHIPPIEPDPNLPGESSDRSFGLNPHVLRFAALFRRLATRNRSAALRELTAWRRDDDPIFARLRIWAAGIPGLLDARTAGKILSTVTNRAFWSERDKRDLLLVLARRWSELSPAHRKLLERRLRRGMPRKRIVNPDHFSKVRAYSIADRLAWLRVQGCAFSFDIDAEIAALRATIPDWTIEEGTHAADSLEGRGGTMHTDTSFAEGLAKLPLEQLIKAALGARERRPGFLEERDPYAGLCEKKPVRVLAALSRAIEVDEEIKIAWTYFLRAAARGNDKPALATLISRRLTQIPQALLAQIILPAASWLETAAKRIFEIDAEAVWALFSCLLEAIKRVPDAALPARNAKISERDWLESSWASAAGDLTKVLLRDPILEGSIADASLPAAWKEKANSLLALPDDHGRFCLVQLSRDLDWCFAIDPAWTDSTILSAIDSGGIGRDAVLAGFLSNARIHSLILFDRMKPVLLEVTTSNIAIKRKYEHILADLCITAWQQKRTSGERWLTDEELRRVLVYGSVDIRSRILWRVSQWKDVAEKLTLFKEVWPLQLVARSSALTGRFCSVAFDDEANFPALVEAILPLVSGNHGDSTPIPFLSDDQTKVFERFPSHSLALLLAVLPIDASKWPYGIDTALDRIQKASKRIKIDPRLIELRRRLAQSR